MRTASGTSRSRRRFVKALAATGAMAALRPGLAWSAVQAAPFVPQSLTLGELAALKAIMARLIPVDAGGGGAVEAQAYVHVDRALAGADAAALPHYHQGLALLDAAARQAGAASLAALGPEAVDGLITKLEAGALAVTIPANAGQQALTFEDGGKGFFALLRRHTVEGMFADPMYGGNQGFLGWQLIGYQGVQYAYAVDDLAIGAKSGDANASIADFGGKPLP